MRVATKLSLGLLLSVLSAIHVHSQDKQMTCPAPFPDAKFYIEDQPDSPVLIKDFAAVFVKNPGDTMGYSQIRVTFYFENRSNKKIESYYWDEPMPDESKWPTGGGDWNGLLPGESLRYSNVFHTQNGPSVVFRLTQVKFIDGTEWNSGRYNKKNVLKAAPICVKPEVWPKILEKRALKSAGWSTPIFADRITEVIDAGSEVIDGVNVATKLFQIRRERLDDIGTCPPNEIMERALGTKRQFDYDVEKYRSFSVNGRVFAYLISYEYVDEQKQSEAGISSASFYLDKAGNGEFTLECSFGNMKPKLPLWLKTSVAK